MSQPEQFKATSANITDEQKAKLISLFPEVVTEGGMVDFDRLKLTLGEVVDTGKERYGMNWPGKADCFKTIQRASAATLVPVRDESVNFDATENLIIEGDNLETLKLLQKAYLGKVKMIYIDPPYNTGNDFIYPDDYTETLETYLRYTGQVDAEGRKFSTNTEADGRFHSKWMNMMYPRLFLARNLLREDGLIFVSIDDTEVANLRAIMNEVFGEEHFLAAIAWEKRYTRSNNARLFYSLKDTILVYRKSEAVSSLRETRSEESKSIYSNPDNDSRGPWTSSSYVNPATKEERKNLVYKISNPHTQDVIEHPTHAWKYEYAEHLRHVQEKRLWWGQKGDAKFPRLKNFLSEMGDGIVPTDVWDYETTGTTDEGGLEVKSLFGEAVFDNPKPTRLIRRMMGLATSSDNHDIILDFFGGSGTTAHAVLDLNRLDGGNRKFILVQLPEPIERKDFSTLTDITKERVRRVIKKLNEDDGKQLQLETVAKQDNGFKVFKLQSSNFKAWNAEQPKDDTELAKQLTLHIDHLVTGRTQEDVLYELLLKSGFPLGTKVEKASLAGKSIFSVADGAMLICLEKELTPEVIKAIAEKKPERVVCLDAGFADNDQLKTNAVQTMKAKGVTKFQTV